MKKNIRLTILPFYVLLFMSFGNAVTRLQTEYTDIYDQIDDDLVSVRIRATGEKAYNTFTAAITNLTDDTLYSQIEPGYVIFPQDSVRDNAVIMKKIQLTLLPHETTTVPLIAYFYESKKGKPLDGETYTITKKAEKQLNDFANYVALSDTIATQAIQQGIYVISHNLSVASIYPDTLVGVKDMKTKIAEITGSYYSPWYYVSYSPDSSEVMMEKPQKLWGTLYYSVRDTANVSVYVKNLDGDTLQVPMKDLQQFPGYNSYNVTVDVSKFETGKYIIEVYEETVLKIRKRFEL